MLKILETMFVETNIVFNEAFPTNFPSNHDYGLWTMVVDSEKVRRVYSESGDGKKIGRICSADFFIRRRIKSAEPAS